MKNKDRQYTLVLDGETMFCECGGYMFRRPKKHYPDYYVCWDCGKRRLEMKKIKRSEAVQIRVMPEERAAIEYLAEKQCRNISEYLRGLIRAEIANKGIDIKKAQESMSERET